VIPSVGSACPRFSVNPVLQFDVMISEPENVTQIINFCRFLFSIREFVLETSWYLEEGFGNDDIALVFTSKNWSLCDVFVVKIF